MPQYDYRIQSPNIGGSILQGMQYGNQLKQQKLNEARAAEQFEINKGYAAGAEERAAGRWEMEQRQQQLAEQRYAEQQEAKRVQQVAAEVKQEQFKTAVADEIENTTYKGLIKIAADYPVLSKSIKLAMSKMDEKVKRESSREAMGVFKALQAGNPGYAKQILETSAVRLEEAGKPDEAQIKRGAIKAIEVDEKTTEFTSGLSASILMGERDFALEMGEWENKRDAAKESLKKSEQSREKIEQEMQDDELRNGGALTAPQKMDYTQKWTNQYLKEGGQRAEDVNYAYQNIKTADLTGVGGLATVLSFMKVIDPTSVVSGQEVTTAKDAPGWDAQMINLYNRFWEDGRLSEKGAKQFISQAKKLRDNAQKAAAPSRKRITTIANEFGIDPTNIFNPVIQDDQTGKKVRIKVPGGTIVLDAEQAKRYKADHGL